MVGALLRRNPALVAAATGMVAGLAVWAGAGREAADWILFATLMGVGAPLVFRTVRGMFRGDFAADIVASLAIVAAAVLHQYFAGVVIVLMQTGGEALERYAMTRASASLDALLAKAPRIAHWIAGDGQIEDVSVERVAPGDSLIIRPGEMVPVDAVVTAGRSTIDQSTITGEPFPVTALEGTTLLSGSLNLEGALTVRALRVAEQSQYQRIIRLVQDARAEKPPIQRLADRWAVWFTPATLAVCALAFAVTRDPDVVLAVLVVATPCPLILAVPVAVIAGISRAADAGIIVKSGAAIEQLGLADIVVFDKTGTLTLGHPFVSNVVALDGSDPSEVLRLAGSVEQFSSHHLGQAIVNEARRREVRLDHPSDFSEMAGSGVQGTIDQRRVAVGSASYLATAGVTTRLQPERPTAFVAVDRKLVGAIEFADRLRRQVPDLLSRLAALGIQDSVMLTGDARSSAESIAAEAGIRRVRADLLPADKVAAVAELKNRHRVVVMVGDGINDAPALAAATVGIALGAHGTAAASEAADVVVLVDDVSRVGDAIAISRRMRRIALQSITVGLGVSLALMGIASLGFLTPTWGALMQEALDAVVIVNALRARTGG